MNLSSLLSFLVLAFTSTNSFVEEAGLTAMNDDDPTDASRLSNHSRLPYLIDVRHTNPAEPPHDSKFQDPKVLKQYGYTGDVINIWKPPQSAITFETFDNRIFPSGSPERQWVEETAAGIRLNITSLHSHGLQALFWTDLIVVPRQLFQYYKVDLTGSLQNDVIRIELAFTQKILRYMIQEVFRTFPHMDGLVIRTGEIYTQAMPYHRGNNPLQSRDSHVILLNILRDEVCVKANKLLIYRSWSTQAAQLNDPEYYLNVTNSIEPHPNLIFAVKHTQLDYWRTVPFNPTIAIGKHPQIIEVQCQREYEGKGSYPNYIGKGVIDGFEEFDDSKGDIPQGLSDVISSPLIVGIWTWSRGGGWGGPHISSSHGQELWIDLNTYVISQYALDTTSSEESLFNKFAIERLGIPAGSTSLTMFRQLVLKATSGVLHGHYISGRAAELIGGPLTVLNWSRDYFLGGNDHALATDFDRIVRSPNTSAAQAVLDEKAQALRLWKEVRDLSTRIQLSATNEHAELEEYLRTSSLYGSLLFESVVHSWTVMLVGHIGDYKATRGSDSSNSWSRNYDINAMKVALDAYDKAWEVYTSLPATYPNIADLYIPYEATAHRGENGSLNADYDHGMKPTLDYYRTLIERRDDR